MKIDSIEMREFAYKLSVAEYAIDAYMAWAKHKG